MKITYDPQVNVAYISFKDKPLEVQTIELSSDVNLDIAPDGTLYGIELLNANEQLMSGSDSIFKLVNEATGRSAELKMPA